MLNGGYVMLDVTPYENGETYADLYFKLVRIKEANKPLIVVDSNISNLNNNLCLPINASMSFDDGSFFIGYVVFDSIIQIEVDADGSFTKAVTALGGE